MEKSFVFDLYNTLIDVETDEHCPKAWLPVRDYFSTLGIECEWKDLMSAFDRYWAEFQRTADKSKFDYPECDCVAQLAYIAERVGGKVTRPQAKKALKIMRLGSRVRLKLFEGTKELLSELSRRGARTYLLSNAQSAFTLDEIKEVGLSDAFDGMLLSSDCGVKKPDRAFFGMLFDRYGIDKRFAVMVGDDPFSDGEGAKGFGIPYINATGGAASHADELFAFLEDR